MKAFLEIELELDYTYEPEEPMVRYYKDGSGYPGADANLEITSCKLNGKELPCEFLSKSQWDELEAQCLEHRLEQNEI